MQGVVTIKAIGTSILTFFQNDYYCMWLSGVLLYLKGKKEENKIERKKVVEILKRHFLFKKKEEIHKGERM